MSNKIKNSNTSKISKNKKDLKKNKNKKAIKLKDKLKNNSENNSKTNSENNNSINNSVNKSNNKQNNKSIENIIIKPANKNFSSYLKNYKLNNNKNQFKNDIKIYQNSFDDMLEFSKSITTQKKNAINCIIYHAENSDGIMSANIAVNYLLEHKKSDILIIPTKPFSGYGGLNHRLTSHNNELKDKNILILDLQYNKENLEHLRKLSKNLYIIDDHPVSNSNNKSHFIGKNHATIAYTWKFFYPKKDIPLYVQIIDNDDRKLQLPFLAKYRKISSFYNYRIFHNPYLKIKFDEISHFKYLNSVISDEFNIISNIIGHYYEELANNIKDQVARNARKATFQGQRTTALCVSPWQ